MDYPRPQMRRPAWQSLDGAWQFAFDDAGQHLHPDLVVFDREIRVPYAPEAPASGIGDVGYHKQVWYRRDVALDPAMLPQAGDRLLLHFGAVDYRARVWINGAYVGEHEGGHVPFSFEVDAHAAEGRLRIEVLAEDDPHDMAKPRGKQDWRPTEHVIWYPRTTGIWQSVWLERVPAAHLRRLHWTPDVITHSVRVELELSDAAVGGEVEVRLSALGQVLAQERFRANARRLDRRVEIMASTSSDDRDLLLWSPEHPQLIDAQIIVRDAAGNVRDVVESYTALRSVATENGRFLLNDRPYYLRMVLDQGYWRDTLMSATSEALRADVELIKRLGFNGARKHQKAEDPRWLYWCDVLGLCVWGEMPSAYAFGPQMMQRTSDEWRAIVDRDRSHPCVVAWVPINESWGVSYLSHDKAQADYTRALYHQTRAQDPSRPAVGNDGWEMNCGDLVNVHDYHADPAVIEARYSTPDAVANTLKKEQPGSRRLMIEGFEAEDRPVMLTEFGGIACVLDGQGWGYSVATDGEQLLARYEALLAAVNRCGPLAGFCYTQLTDTFLEKNGLLSETREPKADILRFAKANVGAEAAHRDWSKNPLGYSRLWLEKLATRS
ncbi:glycoside hydrolase family 2 TIM barrel-domain containing protein [Niveibacterium sp. SC-1]|uniref:glycoside hydrolase family 2 protein n=1 Tax=Niveibacterium sp. SC-1 TaxID=3135646 RepID=UPI00311E5A53